VGLEAPGPAVPAATGKAVASVSAASTAAPLRTGPDKADRVGEVETPTRKRKAFEASDVDEAHGAQMAVRRRVAATDTKSPILTDDEGTNGPALASSSSSTLSRLEESCVTPSPNVADPPNPKSPDCVQLEVPEEPDRLSPAMQVERDAHCPSGSAMERELSSERTVRILATKRVDELTEECESLTLRNAQLVDENALLLQKLERTNIPARGELVRKATANRALQRRIQVLEERRQKLEATVRSRTKEKRALTAKSQWREGKLQSLEGELAAKVVELAKCQGEVQRLRGELAVKTVDAAQCQGEVQRLRSVLDAKTLDVAQCQASMIELSTLHAELRNLVRGQVLARLGANGGQMKSEQEDQSQAAAALVPQPREGMVHTKCSTVEQDSALRGGQALCEREEEREAELEEANATVRRVSADAELQEEQGAREQLSAAHDELQEHARHLEGELARVSRELDKYRLLSLRRFVG
jgi:hypothetical protein